MKQPEFKKAMEMEAEAEHRRGKETSRAKSIWHEESNQIATVLNSIHQVQAHRLDRSRSAQEINKSEAETVDVMETLQRAISNVEKEMAKNLKFLRKEIDTRNTTTPR